MRDRDQHQRTSAPSLTSHQVSKLRTWLEMKDNNPAGIGLPGLLLLNAGDTRDAIRCASNWGPFLIALLIEAKVLEPGENPYEALCEALNFTPSRAIDDPG